MPVLQGVSVTLRPVEAADLEFIQAGVNHPDVQQLLGQFDPTSAAQERDYLEELEERDDAVQLLVEAGGERVGVVEFDPIDRGTGVADFAIWIHPDHQGHGYAREATELMCTYGFEELGLHKVTADVYAANEASRALFESVGFTLEGVGREDAYFDGEFQDSVYYGLLEHEWRAGDCGG